MRGPARIAPLLPVAAVISFVAFTLPGAWAANGPTNDPGSALQWHLQAIDAPAAWAVSTGKGATIAIVDTGIDLNHEDLHDGRITGAVTCLNTNGTVSGCTPGGQDDDGHGTHVAGIAAAITNNGIGVAGVAPDANLLAVKVMSEDCSAVVSCEASGTTADVSAGIHWATDHGATVINLSLGTAGQSVFGPGFSDAVEYAWNHGVIPVVAAGNDFVLSSGFSNEPALVVGALNRAGTKASYSSGVGSAKWALSAPGGELDSVTTCQTAPQGILSTYWISGQTNQYACLAGTSMAAPQVAAAAAILRSAGLSPDQTVKRILSSARPIGATTPDTMYGAGALDIGAATAGLSAAPGATPPTTVERTTLPAPTGAETSATQLPAPGSSAVASPDPATQSAAPLVQLPTTTEEPTRKQATALRPHTPSHELPPGPLAVAVMMAASVGAASGWVLVRGAGWARRTPG